MEGDKGRGGEGGKGGRETKYRQLGGNFESECRCASPLHKEGSLPLSTRARQPGSVSVSSGPPTWRGRALVRSKVDELVF